MGVTRSGSDERTRSLAQEAAFSGPTLVAMWEGGVIRQALVPGVTVVVGRGDDCDVQIVHSALSRRHFALHLTSPPTVEDLGSTHGTRVGAVMLRGQSAPVPPGATIEARPVLVVLQLPDVEPAAGSTALDDIERMLGLVANSNLSVLLSGETGVGKEVAAERIHAASPRSKGPLVKLNCAALSETLLESELFGHERGAFTGAERMKVGLIEAADRGTLFIDEVSELPAATQVKLLRVLESREVQRVGRVAPIAVDLRVIAAANRDLRALVRDKLFREDLYYRLNGITLRISPLRERMHQLPSFVTQLLARHPGPPRMHAAVLASLSRHVWPGNIRELRNVVDRAVMLAAGGEVKPEHVVFDDPAAAAVPKGDLKREMDQIERQRIVQALAEAGQNQTKAARLLGITRRALIVRLDAFGLPRPRKK